MPDKGVLEQERVGQRRAVSELEMQIKGVKDYISTQERNLRNSAESVRQITERSLAEARSDLQVKELRLQQLRQDLANTEQVLNRIAAFERKQIDVQTLERERDRITALLDRARTELDQLNVEFLALTQPPMPQPAVRQYALVFGAGQRVGLPTDRQELLIGCADPNVFPDVDLTPFGGTASGVSRKHAVLRFHQGMWTITDLSSTNGTFVNATRLTPNVPTLLQDQARVRFGGIDATFTAQG